jgi:hypothetical protein
MEVTQQGVLAETYMREKRYLELCQRMAAKTSCQRHEPQLAKTNNTH